MQQHDKIWLERWQQAGYPHVEPLAAGMEAAAYRLGKGLIGKVWAARGRAELERLRDAYAEMAEAGGSLLTPLITEVGLLDGAVVTVERELPGRPLAQALPPPLERHSVPDAAATVLVEVLEFLRRLPATAAVQRLSVLAEPVPLWASAPTWTQALDALVERRVRVYGGQLAARVQDFAPKVEGLRRALAQLPPPALVPLHGDLVPDNVLVDEAGTVSAVLDFGFLSTVGDPAFDAAVTARIYNMYGPAAASTTTALRSLFEERWGYERQRLLVYEAVYAVVTANAYDPAGLDGHFAWCAELLEEVDVTEALLS